MAFTNSHKGTTGIDISHFSYPINFATAYANGARFVWMKAGGGLPGGGYAADSQFTLGNVQAARAAGLKVGFYWFKNPDYAGATNTIGDADNEANIFYGYISSVLGASDMGDLFPILDYEEPSGSITSATSDTAYLFIKEFRDYFKLLSGRQIALYTAYFTLNGMSSAGVGSVPAGQELIYTSTGATIASVCPLWLAANSTPFSSFNYTQFGGYTDWVAWQYVTNVAGYGSANVDVNDSGHISTIAIPPICTGFNGSVVSSTATLRWNQNAYDGTGLAVTKYNVYDVTSTPTILSSVAATSSPTYSVTYSGLAGGAHSYKLVAANTWDEGVPVYTTVTIGGSTIQATINIDNVNFVSGAAFRVGVNNALQTLANLFAGPSAPSVTYSLQFWADTTNSIMWQRNFANSAWNFLYQFGAQLQPQDGWISEADETWTWVSSTSFSSLGDQTGHHQKGDKIKLTSGSVIYSYLVSVVYNGSTSTTFTTTVWAHSDGTSATFATGAITQNFYSRDQNPFGFPDWIPYQFTAVSNSATYTTNAGSRALFKLDGREARLKLSVFGSVGTTATYLLYGNWPTNLAPDDVSTFPFRYSGADLITYGNGSYFTAGTFANPDAVWIGISATHFVAYKVGSVGVPFSASTAQTGFAGTLCYNYN